MEVGIQTMKNLKSLSIIDDSSTKIIKSESMILKFITISLHISKKTKRKVHRIEIQDEIYVKSYCFENYFYFDSNHQEHNHWDEKPIEKESDL